MNVSCETWDEKIIETLAGELADDEAILLEQHLAECASCRREELALRSLAAATREGDAWRESPRLRATLVAELRSVTGRSKGARALDARGVEPGPLRRLMAALERPIAAYAAILLVVAGAGAGFRLGEMRVRDRVIAPGRLEPARTSPARDDHPLLAGGSFAVTPADAIPAGARPQADSL
jgi:anti-sigma factor RsiW